MLISQNAICKLEVTMFAARKKGKQKQTGIILMGNFSDVFLPLKFTVDAL